MKKIIESFKREINRVEGEWKEAVNKLEDRIEDLEDEVERLTARSKISSYSKPTA